MASYYINLEEVIKNKEKFFEILENRKEADEIIVYLGEDTNGKSPFEYYTMYMPKLLEVGIRSYERFIKGHKDNPSGLEKVFREFFPIETDKHIIEFLGIRVEDKPEITPEDAIKRDLTYKVRVYGRFAVIEEMGKRIEEEVFLFDLPYPTENGSFIFNGSERVIVNQIKPLGVVFFKEVPKKGTSMGESEFVRKEVLKFQVIPFRGIRTIMMIDPEEGPKERVIRMMFGFTTEFSPKSSFMATALLRAIGVLNVDAPSDTPEFKKEVSMFLPKGVVDILQVIDFVKNKWRIISNRDYVDEKTGEVIVEKFGDFTEENLGKLQKLKINEVEVIFGYDLFYNTLVEELKREEKIRQKGLDIAKTARNYIFKNTSTLRSIHRDIRQTFTLYSMLFNPKRLNLTSSGRLNLHRKIEPLIPELEKIRKIIDSRFIAAFQEIKKDYLRDLKERHVSIVREKNERRQMTELEELILENIERFFDPDKVSNITALTVYDIIAVIQYMILLVYDISSIKTLHKKTLNLRFDEIDNLGNKHIVAVGEQLENVLREALNDLRNQILDRIVPKKGPKEKITPMSILNTLTLQNAIKSFFGTAQASQVLQQENPLSELTHKRRANTDLPSQVKKHAPVMWRNVHSSQYSRLCPVETPEGMSVGLVNSLASFAQVDEYGCILAPYYEVENGKVKKNKIVYLPPQFDDFYVAPFDTPLDENGNIIPEKVTVRYEGTYVTVNKEYVRYMDISPYQPWSVSTGLIPFLQHNDANRALMGSNMQRQAVPLVLPERPRVATGLEERVVRDTKPGVYATKPGVVIKVDANMIVVLNEDGNIDVYKLPQFSVTNQYTAKIYRVHVKLWQRVKEGELLADGYAMDNGKLALGKNLLVAILPWEGYNFEDAIVVSERLLIDDVFTSVHIKEFETSAEEFSREEKEEITKDIPKEAKGLQFLDEKGIIMEGVEVGPMDILVGKVAPRPKEEMQQLKDSEGIEKLLQIIFPDIKRNVIDDSLRVDPGVTGKVILTEYYSRSFKKASHGVAEAIKEKIDYEHKKLKSYIDKEVKLKISGNGKVDPRRLKKAFDELKEILEVEHRHKLEALKSKDLPASVLEKVRVYLGQVRKIQVGDKLAGRHGNKGVISNILPICDMPYLPDGTPVDIVISPLSIPSRMNLGQLYENIMGWIAMKLDIHIVVQPFSNSEAVYSFLKIAKEYLRKYKNVPSEHLPTDDFKFKLYDGRTGEAFDQYVLCGYHYFMKLIHMAEDKIHARSRGPYNRIIKQPLGGKAHRGAQRLGEMEVWTLEAHGASINLEEFMTVKSDDTEGRILLDRAIRTNEPYPQKNITEAFKALEALLRGMGIAFVPLKNVKDNESK